MTTTTLCLKCAQPFFAPSAAPYRPRCWRCAAALLKARHAREDQLAREPRQSWPEFVAMLADYGFLAGLEFEWSWALYQKYGRHLAKTAGLSDCADLEDAFNQHTYLGSPGQCVLSPWEEPTLSWELDSAPEPP